MLNSYNLLHSNNPPSPPKGLDPEVRTFNTAIIACNMCGQPQEALKVRGHGLRARSLTVGRPRF